jgi:enoyl-CoA hydratase/carnithine racemase
MLEAIRDAVVTAAGDDVGAIVLAGSDGIFSAGLDLPELISFDRPQLEVFLDLFFDAMQALAASSVPVAAAITGHCPAGGAVLSLFCDYRVMADGPFTIGLNEVRVGIPIPAVVAELARRNLGARRAEWALSTGRLLEPSQALEVGYVDELTAPSEVVNRSVAWAREIAELPHVAVLAARRQLRSDLAELVTRHRDPDREWLAKAWFRPEVKAQLAAVVARLKGGG